jgi:hypothetical protein
LISHAWSKPSAAPTPPGSSCPARLLSGRAWQSSDRRVPCPAPTRAATNGVRPGTQLGTRRLTKHPNPAPSPRPLRQTLLLPAGAAPAPEVAAGTRLDPDLDSSDYEESAPGASGPGLSPGSGARGASLHHAAAAAGGAAAAAATAGGGAGADDSSSSDGEGGARGMAGQGAAPGRSLWSWIRGGGSAASSGSEVGVFGRAGRAGAPSKDRHRHWRCQPRPAP